MLFGPSGATLIDFLGCKNRTILLYKSVRGATVTVPEVRLYQSLPTIEAFL
jgi:hypothetical protein